MGISKHKSFCYLINATYRYLRFTYKDIFYWCLKKKENVSVGWSRGSTERTTYIYYNYHTGNFCFLPLNYFERIRLLLQGQPFVLPSIHKAEVKLMAKNLNKGEITATFIIICIKIIHNCLGMHRISGKLKGRIPVSKYAAGTFLTKARIFYFK